MRAAMQTRGSQTVLGFHYGFQPCYRATAKDILHYQGGWIACTRVSPSTDLFMDVFNSRGAASHPDSPSCWLRDLRFSCLNKKHTGALGKEQDVQSSIEKHFTICLFCHKYLCPSLYEGRKCRSEADRNIQTKGLTSGGFCEINVAKKRK